MLDAPGALIIGAACSLLFVRVVAAVQHRQHVRDIVQQHHVRKPSWAERLRSKAENAFAAVPPRLAIGLGLGLAYRAISLLTSAAPLALRRVLPESLVDSAGGRALWLAAKWSIFGYVLQRARQWALNLPARRRD